jgi:hypothetical protein
MVYYCYKDFGKIADENGRDIKPQGQLFHSSAVIEIFHQHKVQESSDKMVWHSSTFQTK